MDVPPSRKAKVFIVTEDKELEEIFASMKTAYAALISASEIQVQDTKDGIGEDAVSVVIPGAVVYIPLEDLVDFEKEKERLKKEQERLKKEFEPKGIPVYPISAVSGKGLKELLYAVQKKLDELPKERMVFEQEFFPEDMLLAENLPYTVEQDPEDEHRFIIEGPKIEKMLGYTNLDSEKGFAFFQRFLKDTGILDELEQAGIQEGDTVKMYGFEFDYYK